MGPIVAKQLGYDYVDRLVLQSIAENTKIPVQMLYEQEKRTSKWNELTIDKLSAVIKKAFSRGIVVGDPHFGPEMVAFLTKEYEDLDDQYPLEPSQLNDDIYIEAIKKGIRTISDVGNVVIVGRASPIILSDDSATLRVGITASMEERIRRIMVRDNLGFNTAQLEIEKSDTARQLYFKKYFDVDDPEDSNLYHIMINSSDVNIKQAAFLITSYAQEFYSAELSDTIHSPAQNLSNQRKVAFRELRNSIF